MKKIIFLISFPIVFSTSAFSQCFPDFIYTSLGIPGVFPPSISIPNSPVPLGISDGSIGSNYNQTLTLVVLEDTTLDIGFLLPVSVVSAMNAAGIGTVMTLDVNHVTFEAQGLPNGLSYQCDQSNCEFPSSIDGCMQISGIPTQAGNFSVPISMLINVQIPAITDPIFGTTIFPATALDIPSFTANEYDLFIADATSGMHQINQKVEIFPNPATEDFIVRVDKLMDIRIFNSLGELVFKNTINTDLKINRSEIGTGIFILELSEDNHLRQYKLIIK